MADIKIFKEKGRLVYRTTLWHWNRGYPVDRLYCIHNQCLTDNCKECIAHGSDGY